MLIIILLDSFLRFERRETIPPFSFLQSLVFVDNKSLIRRVFPQFLNRHPKIFIKLTIWKLGKNNLASYGYVDLSCIDSIN